MTLELARAEPGPDVCVPQLDELRGPKKITVCGQVLAIISIHFYFMMCQTNVSHETQWIETI